MERTHRTPELRPRRAWAEVIAAPIAIVLSITACITVAFAVAPVLGGVHGVTPYVAVVLIGTIAGEWCFLALFVAWLRRHGQTLGDLGWSRPAPAWAILAGVAIAAIYAGVTVANPAVRAHVLDLTPLKALAVAAALTAGVVEETLCRGFIMTRLAAAGRGPLTQLVASGVIFALLHVQYGLVGAVFTLGLGLALAALYHVSRRSLIPAVVSHAIIDLIIEPGLLLMAFGAAFH